MTSQAHVSHGTVSTLVASSIDYSALFGLFECYLGGILFTN